MAYWHSVCPACEQGRLFVTKVLDTEELFLLCEECEAAWRVPEEINVNVYFDIEFGMSVRANSADVERSGWCRYPLVQL